MKQFVPTGINITFFHNNLEEHFYILKMFIANSIDIIVQTTMAHCPGYARHIQSEPSGPERYGFTAPRAGQSNIISVHICFMKGMFHSEVPYDWTF